MPGANFLVPPLHLVWVAAIACGPVSAGCDGSGAELAAISIETGATREALTIDVDDRHDLVLIARYDDDFTEPVTEGVVWSSDADEVASVDDDGRVRGEGIGTARISASYRGLEAAVELGVNDEPSALILATDGSSSRVAAGLSLAFSATLKYEHGDRVDVTGSVEWQSSAPAIAEVDGAGLVTTTAPGEAVISASGFGLTQSKEVTVGEAVVVDLQLTPDAVTLASGESATIAALGTFSDDNQVDITARARFESSNRAIADVDDGLVRALQPGQATISAERDGVFATTTVTVTAATDGDD